ncbi:MAG: hypothetical protein ACLS3Y_04530 [Collinsella sp.]
MTVKGLSEELGIKDSTLKRWAREYERWGQRVPRKRSPKINKDYEIVKLRRVELERENEILKISGLLESRPCVRFEFLSYRSIEESAMRVKVVWSVANDASDVRLKCDLLKRMPKMYLVMAGGG